MEKRTMRKLETSPVCRTVVFATDERGQGNANHVYRIEEATDGYQLLDVKFQNGPILEAGVNGVMNEDLLAILIDRLRGFQSGPYACRQNAIALTKLEEALMWLNHRTFARVSRGVEGTN